MLSCTNPYVLLWSKVMKSKTLIFACILSASTFSFSAFSQNSKFCSDPIKTICIDTKTQIDARKLYIDKLKNEIAQEANKNSAPKIDKLEKPNSDYLQIVKYEARKKYISDQEIIKSAISKTKDIESVIYNQKNISLFKHYMKQAVEETNFSQSIRASLKKTIDEVVIGTYGDYLELARSKEYPEDGFSNPCGTDGMNINAFASDLRDKKFVLICPGYLITLNQIPNEQEKFNSIIQVISHEMGHHLYDHFVRLDIYRPYLTCLIDNYGHEFQNNEIRYHSKELISDQWGLKVLAIYLKEKRLSYTHTESIFKSNFAHICNTRNDGTHPSGDFRIETLLRVNPEISDHLSCNNSQVKKAACTFDGAVNI